MHLIGGTTIGNGIDRGVSKRQRADFVSNDSDNCGTKCNRVQKYERGKRIPCPVDPSHLIFESALSKHVLVCPAAKHQQDVASQEFYSQNVNRGGFGELCAGSSGDRAHKDPSHNRHHELAVAVLRVFNRIFRPDKCQNFSRLDDESKNEPIEHLKCITQNEIYESIREIDLSSIEEQSGNSGSTSANAIKNAQSQDHDERQTRSTDFHQAAGRLSDAIACHRIKAGGPRHLHQIASILGHLRENGLLTNEVALHNKNNGKDFSTASTPSINVIEMGAGRGMLGLVVAGAIGASSVEPNPSSKVQLFLVDRSGSRAKAETKIRKAIRDASNRRPSTSEARADCLKLDAVTVMRIKCDLAHVHMPAALPFLCADQSSERTAFSHSSKTMVIAKHLCGSGTDLALKSLREIAPTGSIDGCVMATCCHGLCEWKDYTGRDCLLELFCGIGRLSSFGESDFDVLKRWTSASVLDDRRDSGEDFEDDHADCKHGHKKDDGNVFTVVKELDLSCGGNGLGRACQRIIDYGRCDYMKKTLFCSQTSSVGGSNGGSFEVNLIHYVPRNVTPQNALIMAFRK
jgi:tRNA:m4X modification enzyme